MCGIIGFSWQDKALMKRMLRSIAHRGPNDEGIYTSKDMSLGHRRLSIIDTSSSGHQPMFNETKTVAVIFNGEIWNYKTLKTELANHHFLSESDTEVIIHGYEEWGERVFSRLEGMFAIALWDIKKKTLILARDARGKKPLYYALTKKEIIFASEMKTFLNCPFVSKKLNLQALADYLGLRFVPGTQTIFSEVSRLAPGTLLIFKKGTMTIKPYAAPLSYKPGTNTSVSEANALIAQAVEKRLMADVPIGVFLSGGLDSSTLVAYMAQLDTKIKTFSVGFTDEKTDETKYARMIATQFKTDHTEIKLTPNILQYLPEVIWYGDEPLADPACLPTFLLCKEVGKHVRVVLSGEGGDETFGGYHTFTYAPYLEWYHHVPFLIRKKCLTPFCSYFSSYASYPRKQMLALGAEISADNVLANNYERLFYFPFTSNEKKEVLISTPRLLQTPLLRAIQNEHSLRIGALRYYFEEWLPNDLLMKADKMGMAHGLEIRTPFLDKNLVDYFLATPLSARHNRTLFRKVIGSKLPSAILSKPKQGFTLPLSSWFSDKKLIEKISPYMERLKKRSIFSPFSIDHLLLYPHEHRADHKLWTLLVFELWAELYLDEQPLKEVTKTWKQSLK